MERLEFKEVGGGGEDGAPVSQSNITYACFLLLQCIFPFVLAVLQSDQPRSQGSLLGVAVRPP